MCGCSSAWLFERVACAVPPLAVLGDAALGHFAMWHSMSNSTDFGTSFVRGGGGGGGGAPVPVVDVGGGGVADTRESCPRGRVGAALFMQLPHYIVARGRERPRQQCPQRDVRPRAVKAVRGHVHVACLHSSSSCHTASPHATRAGHPDHHPSRIQGLLSNGHDTRKAAARSWWGKAPGLLGD